MKKQAKKPKRQSRIEKITQTKQFVNRANTLENPLKTICLVDTFVLKDASVVTLSCTKSKDTIPNCISWINDIMERNMKSMYEQSHWGWDPRAKYKEITDSAAWHLVASMDREFIGFSHFRFDVDYGIEVLYCYELQLEPSIRRKGLGRYMMTILECMAAHNRLKKVVLTVFKHNPEAVQFFQALGYRIDNTSPALSDEESYIILSKETLHCTERH